MGTHPAVVTDHRILWDSTGLLLEIRVPVDAPPTLARISTDAVVVEFGDNVPLVELLAVGSGHTQASSRLINTTLGAALRYSGHREYTSGPLRRLDLELETAGDPSLRVTVKFESFVNTAVVRSRVLVQNVGVTPITLQSVTSWSCAFGAPAGSTPDFTDWTLTSGSSDWLAEGRWQQSRLRGIEFPVMAQQLTGREPRGSLSVTSRGTWSTGAALPVAGVVSAELGIAWLWQVEHNGPWRWEVGENGSDGYLALSGPTELDHDWRAILGSGDTFESVPVAVAVASDLDGAVAELTGYRRFDRRPHVDNAALPVVFNDYMNTLNGDPTTEKLLPLIDAAASVGAEVFCIDAGWYDDGGDWWDSVGEWLPSTVRFPGGLGAVIDHITSHGMVPGLWLEPEVVGVRSPAASRLPDDAFFQRDGVRIIEHDRYHLDLRHPAAIAHLDEVVDRLVRDFGIGFFKLDYNIDPGLGTDVAASSIGAGLLDHNRAHQAWLDGVATRHPELILENCASGAMRTDWALLSRLQMQSTSDQQDFLRYPPIAASAPMSMLPEQAANWAYPQPTMSDEHIAFCLATGLLGRFYVSGYLNLMTEAQRGVVSEAIATAKAIRASISSGAPVWPLGLPAWNDEWVALGLRDESTLVTVWKRSDTPGETRLDFPHLVGAHVTARTVFPTSLPEWDTTWDPASGTLTIFAPVASEAARTIELVGVVPASDAPHNN